MEELKKIESPYRVSKKENEYIFEFDNTFDFCEDAIAWCEEKQRLVVAFQRYTSDCTYDIEYVLFTPEFEIDEVYQESEGVNPRFLIAPNGEIWIVMSATMECYPLSTDVTLPLFDRFRIDEPVLKRDTGMDYFLLNGQTYGFIIDMWGEGKESKLIQNKYDKAGLYKDRKGKKLKNIYGGFVTSIGEKAYLSYDDCVYEISEKLQLNLAGSFEQEKDCLSFILDRDESTTTYIRRDENGKELYLIKYSNEGKLLKTECIFSAESMINTMTIQSLQDGSKKIQFVSNGVNILGYKDGDYFIYHGKPGDNTNMLKFGILILHRSRVEESCFKIIKICEKEFKRFI